MKPGTPMNRISKSLTLLACMLAGFFGMALPARADMSVKGFISQVSPGANSVSVDTGKDTVTFLVGTFTWLSKDNFESRLSNLRIGDKVRASVFQDNGMLQASRLEAQTHGRRKTIQGTLKEISTSPSLLQVDQRGKGNERLTPVAYDDATHFIYGGSTGSAAALKVGDNVTILSTVQANGTPLATRVDVSTTVKDKQAVLVFGFLKSISDETLVIKSWKDGEEEFIAMDTVRLMSRNKRPVLIRDFMRGDRILAMGNRNFAGGVDGFMITAQSPNLRFTGTIETIDASNKTVRLKPFGPNTPSVTLLILPASILVLNGRDVTFEDIRVGDLATITCITHPEGPWGVASMELVRMSGYNSPSASN
ncbi:MAG: hypothetical protein KY468_06825 [Armatimonadetes bacterium]|nr:hypothetical protein [Armatimonadota bacterium]